MTERVFNPFTGELDAIGINTEGTTPNNGDIVQYNSTTGFWEFVTNTGSNSVILEEVPSGSINDINKTFTLVNSVNNQDIIVFLNGVRLQRVTIIPATSPASSLTPFGIAAQGKAFGGSGATTRGEFQHASGSSSFTLGSPASTEGDGDFIVVTYRKA